MDTKSADIAKEKSSSYEMVRQEADSIGVKDVPLHALYGVQTLRAYENFPMTHQRMCTEMIHALAYVKKACAIANEAAGTLSFEKEEVIVKACDAILHNQYHDAFIVDPIQGGAGTSMNMNANEVIANIAIRLFGGQEGDYRIVHPNDDINMGQSTNDVIPTAGKLASLFLLSDLEKSLQELICSFRKKAEEFDDVIKMGRTQLQDAVPVRLGQEFDAYASAIQRGLDRIRIAQQELHQINLGGTAIGTCINASRGYYFRVVTELSELTHISFEHCSNMIDGTQNIDCFASISSALKNCALTLSKISNDLRLLSSGPKTGIAEIALPAKQNGSSIMPGKINPVIPEVVSQAAYKVIGNDTTIAFACEAGQLELNAFEPVVFYSLFESIRLLTNACQTLRMNCVDGIEANRERCKELLEESVGMVTALCPTIGYQAASTIAKESLHTGVCIRTILINRGILSKEECEEVLEPMRMTSLAQYQTNHQS